ncbi:hypothetical protein [Methylobacter psychrophilus]|uniref:hypothetical protein n=1 Tax=Methylobacter psychrophilus TaxID=96941 RepID=UPI0021D49F0C|nr:hypothetical protein [Methylobacter psychrophilus]
MATWRLTPKHKKSFIEIETWKKGKLELVHDIVWYSGSLTIESTTKPEIDLANKDGLDPDNNDYGYDFEFEESADGDGEYTYPEGLSAAEEAKLETLIENEELENAGWVYGGNEYYLIGELELTQIND